MSTDIKANVKQEIKRLVAASYNLPKIAIQYIAGLYFSFNLGRYFIQFDLLRLARITKNVSLSRKVHKSAAMYKFHFMVSFRS